MNVIIKHVDRKREFRAKYLYNWVVVRNATE